MSPDIQSPYRFGIMNFPVRPRCFLLFSLAVGLLLSGASAQADFASARCEREHLRETAVVLEQSCVFSQRQGFVSISLEDGSTFLLSPSPNAVGNFTDQDGKPVYRQSGLGDRGLIFRWSDQVIRIYWQTDGE